MSEDAWKPVAVVNLVACLATIYFLMFRLSEFSTELSSVKAENAMLKRINANLVKIVEEK